MLVFKLLNTTGELIEDVNLGFSLHDNYDIGIANLYSVYQKELFTLTKGYNEVKFNLKKVSITPGYVTVKGRIEVGGVESDFLQNELGSILIEMGDFYNTGEIGQSNWGKFLIEGTWLKK